MPSKTFVLDTNVLLYEPEALLNFGESELIIPLEVLEALDKMKHFSDELGKNARHVIRFIDELKGNIMEGIKLESGGILRLWPQDFNEKKGGFPLFLDSKKHRILYTAYCLKEEGRKVTLISKDFVVRIKAELIGIEAQNYENRRAAYHKLYKGLRKEEVSQEFIDTFLSRGSVKLEDPTLCANEYLHFSTSMRSEAIGIFNAKRGQVERLSSRSRKIWGIRPLNLEQECAMDLLMNDEIKLVTLIGQAGTGKTLMALTCGLQKSFDEGVYDRILISRPIMPLGKDIGYLPGTKEEKMFHWMQPIYDNLEYICKATSGASNGIETKQWIMQSEKIEMEALTFIRGRSLASTYMIIDEAQNLTPHEIKTIISRAGKGTKVVLTGDPTQIDNPYLDKDSNALTYVVSRFQSQQIYGHMIFEKTERSELAAIAAKVL